MSQNSEFGRNQDLRGNIEVRDALASLTRRTNIGPSLVLDEESSSLGNFNSPFGR